VINGKWETEMHTGLPLDSRSGFKSKWHTTIRGYTGTRCVDTVIIVVQDAVILPWSIRHRHVSFGSSNNVPILSLNV